MPPIKHAVLSASGAKRWISCPGSVHMQGLFPQKGSSPAADEGTLAHALAELLIGSRTGDETAAKEIDQLRDEVTDFYKAHPQLNGSFEAMQETIQEYVDFILEEFTKAQKEDAGAVLASEQHVRFDKWVPDGFGTSDVVICYGDTIEVIDLKYGKGVPISAVGNPQIRLYALGSIELFDLIYDFKKVRAVIYQPRLNSVTSEELTVQELIEWADEVVAPAAKEALSKDAKYHPGDWCASSFCPGSHACKARAEYLLELEKYDDDPALLSREEMSDALYRIDQLEKWRKSLSEFAFNELEAGRPIPGWKLVEGRSLRKYADTDKVAEALLAAGYERIFKSPELLGITDMENTIGKKKFKEILTDKELVIKPAGAPKLAPDKDNRPALNTAVTSNDFDE